MAQYTANYQLHQWVPEDNFLRTDFNTDFQKIDAALAGLRDGKVGPEALEPLESGIASAQSTANGKAAVSLGSYVGNGTLPRTISLGYTPKAVFVGISANVLTALNGGGAPLGILIQSGGSQIQCKVPNANTSGETYCYMAVR